MKTIDFKTIASLDTSKVSCREFWVSTLRWAKMLGEVMCRARSMSKQYRLGSALLNLLIVSASLTVAGEAKSDILSQVSASDFVTFCAQTLPDFNNVSKTAEKMNLSSDQLPGKSPEQLQRVNGWTIDKKIDSYHLFVAELSRLMRSVLKFESS